MLCKVSYVHSICVEYDAISAAIRNEILWLLETQKYAVKLYVHRCDFEDLPHQSVHALADVAFDPHFQSSDLVVFHFGIVYSLFNLLPIVPQRAKRLVVFHNITPKEFVALEHHPTIEQSFAQMANILFADHVTCVSHTNLAVLRTAGIDTPASVLPLAVPSDLQIPDSKPSAQDGIIRLAFVGRFVRAKGPGELLAALQGVLQRHTQIVVQLDMIGNISFSDATLLGEIRQTAAAMQRAYGDRLRFTIHGNASEAAKQHILREADVFVLPTYHEGFCVPIIEAFASGCKVIAYDNSNIPAVAGGFARLTSTGNIDALADAMAETIADIRASAWRGNGCGSYTAYVHALRGYVAHYAPQRIKRRFLNFMADCASAPR